MRRGGTRLAGPPKLVCRCLGGECVCACMLKVTAQPVCCLSCAGAPQAYIISLRPTETWLRFMAFVMCLLEDIHLADFWPMAANAATKCGTKRAQAGPLNKP